MKNIGWSSLLRVATLMIVAIELASPHQAQARALTIVLAGTVSTLDPTKTVTVGTDLSVISHLYTPLVDRGPDLKLVPGLATSWVPEGDLKWKFALRHGTTFPNGENLDAAAVKWNIDHILDPKTGARIKPWFDPIQSVTVTDPDTIEITTKAPYPDLPAQMTAFFLMAPKWTEQNNPSIAAMGTGPYDLVEFTSGARVAMKAKPNRPDAANFEGVIFKMIPDTSARVASLLASDADLVMTVPPADMAQISKSGRGTAGSVDSTRPMIIKFNMLKPPFKDNPKLIKALNYAVDKEGIVASLWNGLGGVESCQPMSPAYFGYNPDLKPDPYDPAKARALLAEAGYAKGLKFTLEVPLGRFLQASDIGQAIAAELVDVGVDVTIRETEYSSWLTRLMNHDMADAIYIGLSWPTLDAGGLLAYWERTSPLAYYDNPELTQSIVNARSTVDPATRLRLYKTITEKLCAEPNAIYLFYQPVTYAQSNRIKWSARGDDWVRAMDVQPR